MDIYKSYEGQPLLAGVSFSVAAGETVCLLGASGSGKSTLLRIIAGLENAESGRLLWYGQDLASLPAHQRGFGLVFQDYALFPHLNVADNVAFGLRMQNRPRQEIERRVAEALALVNLSAFAARRVTDLSGGEQQRVALARALAPRPRLLMFDEPLGALDRSLRQDLLEELRRILRSGETPAIYVTHDQEEAFALADRILLLHEGRILRDGSPAEVWRRPGSAWAARFLGLGNVLTGRALGQGRVETAFGVLETTHREKEAAGSPVSLLIRPAAARLGPGVNPLGGRVADILFQDDRYRVRLDNGLVFHLPQAPARGEFLTLHVPPEAVEWLA
ncbi:MAG: ABC transporter ATP-binding protein [Anaerolineales bacterium]